MEKITPDELISTGTILQALADIGQPLEKIISAGRQDLFRRRVTADFGLPEPDLKEVHKWRIRSVAKLLATDAASKLGEEGFSMSDWIIPPGNTRIRALELLDQWQRDLRLQPKLEILAEKADALLDLQPMTAACSCTISEPLASFKGERALFEDELKQIAKFENLRNWRRILPEKEKAMAIMRKVSGANGRRKRCPGISWPISGQQLRYFGKMTA